MTARESASLPTSHKSTSIPIIKDVSVRRELHPILALQHEVNKLYGDFFSETLPTLWRSSDRIFNQNPAADVLESDKDFKITAEVPGMDPKDISISITDQNITIKGEKKDENKEERDGYFRQERYYGAFKRVIALPSAANTEKTEAHISKGILTITLLKKPDSQSKTRQIDIKQVA